jgi:aspartate aminotransferase
MYDQIYSALSFTDEGHVDPVTLRPELRPYVIFVDGLSKSFAATGIRVGWAFGPTYIIDKMKAILSHIGAWAPKAEQIASARFLANKNAVNEYMVHFSSEIKHRLSAFYAGFQKMGEKGLGVKCIEPMAAIYLTVQFNIIGKQTPDGKIINSTPDITAYLLNEAKIAIVPFVAFGAAADSTWFRISIGTCKKEQIESILMNIENSLTSLK